MKKLFAIVLAVAMIAAMAIAVSAEAITATGNNAATITVSGDYVDETFAPSYYVTLSVESLTFTYNGAGYTWDTTDMKWVVNEAADWEAKEAGISITSKSSAAVTATFSASATAPATLGFKTAQGTAATAVVELASAANETLGEKGAEQTGSVTVVVGGSITTDSTIGTITVALA